MLPRVQARVLGRLLQWNRELVLDVPWSGQGINLAVATLFKNKGSIECHIMVYRFA